MKPAVDLGRNQIQALSRVLSRHLSRTAKGREIIRTFENNRDLGSAALLDYLDTRLQDQPQLQKQVKDALGEEAGEKFTTIVASGGHVDQIINAGTIENLSIQYYIFQDNWQVLTFLLGVVLIGSTVASGIWWFQQPKVMTGDFNVVVAEFKPTGDAQKIAPIVSQRIFGFLNEQYMSSSFRDVQVEHEKIGLITSAEEARLLAKKINAQLVIYGDVTVIDDQVLVAPQFYVVEAHKSDVGEMNGEHKFSAQINMAVDDLTTPSSEGMVAMKQNTSILTEFTKAIVYLEAGKPADLALAGESINRAIAAAEPYPDFSGEEVLYLIASDIARRQTKLDDAQHYLDEAFRLNRDYGRGYLAQANIYYDQGNYYLASQSYEKAVNLEDKPLGSYILEKGSMGLGNICFVQYQDVWQNVKTDETSITALSNCALQNYQVVINSYSQQEDPDEILIAFAVGAYYSSGIIFQTAGQDDAARLVYEQALNLNEDVEMEKKIQKALDEVNQK